VPTLANHFLEKSRKKLNKNIIAIEDRAINAMVSYHWPGNIREMQNVIERSAVLALDNVIKLENMPAVFSDIATEAALGKENLHSFKAERDPHVSKVERALIKRYLAEAGGNVSRAAKLANIPRRTFYRILEKHGLKGGSSRQFIGDC